MKTKKYKNIEKAFFTAVFLSSIFLCLSCSNLFSAKTAGNNSDTGNRVIIKSCGLAKIV